MAKTNRIDRRNIAAERDHMNTQKNESVVEPVNEPQPLLDEMAKAVQEAVTTIEETARKTGEALAAELADASKKIIDTTKEALVDPVTKANDAARKATEAAEGLKAFDAAAFKAKMAALEEELETIKANAAKAAEPEPIDDSFMGKLKRFNDAASTPTMILASLVTAGSVGWSMYRYFDERKQAKPAASPQA